MGLKLYVDDKRDFPKGFECVRTYEDCLLYFSIFNDFDFVDLDYNLGEEKTGLDILIWMKENGKKPKHINIHSNHIVGMRLMKKYADENFKDSSVTMNY
ncbi:cyclic-phosphate processing receiver domain-containing protein [uncultured Ruminococcus sp.]|uniref:cyclic-phosphate processing receiver domain-containing protein n=1 Tax=uncultured Ruminococcus sp. TaxID=165186 RepID=UPI0025FB391E|nr:cyclic-phosphate processing receiver domain-containing protein [uncultured Ruminococcus sp.]